MSLFYNIAYRLGFAPWEKAATHPPATEQVAAILDREEKDRQPPFGRALDLGCGRGIWSIHLAQRGWQVTGIDLVPRALHAARKRASAAGVEVTFVQGDVTALRDAGVGSNFSLVWDLGTIHGLLPEQRRAVGREISAVTTDDAAILMLAWTPGRRRPLPRGASQTDIEAAFPEWRVINNDAFDATGLPKPLRNVQPRFYRLLRG